jgi:hypothetical protein
MRPTKDEVLSVAQCHRVLPCGVLAGEYPGSPHAAEARQKLAALLDLPAPGRAEEPLRGEAQQQVTDDDRVEDVRGAGAGPREARPGSQGSASSWWRST